MPDIDQHFSPAEDHPQGGVPAGWLCKVSKAPSGVTHTLSVTIDQMGRQEFNKVRWMPRYSGDDAGTAVLPDRGDRGLAVFDEAGDAWLTVWWPS